MKKKLSTAECLLLLREYISNDYSKFDFERKHDLPFGWINRYLSIFKIEDKPHYVSIMSDKLSELENIPNPLENDDELRKTIFKLNREIRQLKHNLKLTNLTCDAYKYMIEEAKDKDVIAIIMKLDTLKSD
jgi:hypothetical protein